MSEAALLPIWNQMSEGDRLVFIDRLRQTPGAVEEFRRKIELEARRVSGVSRWPTTINMMQDIAPPSERLTPDHQRILNQILLRAKTEKGLRITVSMPPQTGKSSLLSKYGPLWMFDNNPDSRIHVIGYNVGMATKQTRPMRDMIRAFPELFSFQLDPKLQRADHFAASGRQGFIRATGIYGGITGYPATDIIIDDPIKDIREARSAVVSEALWDQFRSSVLTRLPTGDENLIIIHTRWAVNDLIGRCHVEQGLKTQGGTWEHINIPAICFEPNSDPLGRAIGDPLWPDRISMDSWNNIKETQAEFWFSMYQGVPNPPGGGSFKMKNARFFTTLGKKINLIKDAGMTEEPNIVGQFITVDLAVSTASTADNTAIAFWQLTDKNELLLRDMIADRIAGPDQLPTLYSVWQRWGAAFPIFIESVQYQLAFVQAAEKAGLPIIKFQPKGTKEARSITAQALWKANGIFLPQNAPWLADYLAELERFPDGGGHDDMVDVTSMAAIVRVWPEVIGRKRKKRMGAFLG